MPKMSDPTTGLSGSDLERVTLKGAPLHAYRDFWERSAEVDSIHAISDQDDEQSFEVSGREEAEVLAALLPAGGSALEIGCGTGRIMQHLARSCKRLHGVDISRAMVEQGRRRLAYLTNVSFEVGNGYDLAPFADESLDLVYSLFAFQHMPKTTAYNYFAESARVLRPGGVLRFQVPNLLRDDHFLAFHHFTQPWFVEHPYPMNYYTPSEVSCARPPTSPPSGRSASGSPPSSTRRWRRNCPNATGAWRRPRRSWRPCGGARPSASPTPCAARSAACAPAADRHASPVRPDLSTVRRTEHNAGSARRTASGRRP